jgi:DNA-3-methyladenine glycosylase II
MRNLLDQAIAHFKEVDPIMYAVTQKLPPLEKTYSANYFLALVESVVSQQLSVKAADTIFGRLKLLSDDAELTAEAIVQMDGQKMRDAGLSWSKVSYVKNIAEYTLVSDKVFEKFPEMTDEEIISELVKIKGVGRWTAEMFLIFTMGRPDVFSPGDLGLMRGIQKLYGFGDTEPTKAEMEEISKKWKPYRSIASRYLWRSLDSKTNS